MELTGSGNQLRDPEHPQDSRSVLQIDLNKIPSPSSVETLPDSIDIVRTYHENPAPPPGGPAGIPSDVSGSACGACGRPEVRGRMVVCDGCERGFHLGCAETRARQDVSPDEWVCGDCVSGGVKSKRWPLGVRSKQLLDMNASPPSDFDGEGSEELQDLSAHSMWHALSVLYEVRGQRLKSAPKINLHPSASIFFIIVFLISFLCFGKLFGLPCQLAAVALDSKDCSQRQKKHNQGDNSFGAPVTYSNFCNWSAFAFQNPSGVVAHGVRRNFEDILNHSQSMAGSCDEVDMDIPLATHGKSNNAAIRLPSRNPSEIFLHALRDFISEKHGVLEEGWRVEFRQPMSSSEVYAVYCAPDGKIFDSVYEVACYLGLMPDYNFMESEISSEKSLSSLSRKRKPKRTPVANGLSENRGSLVNRHFKDASSNVLKVGCHSTCENSSKATEVGRDEDDCSDPQQFANGFPLRFEDFFVLSLGKVDARPSYYDVNMIWPIGYKSCWHDKITGSLFTSEVLEGGDSGPLFRVRRCSCSEFSVPFGSTILSVSNNCQFVGHTDEGERKTNDGTDCDIDESIQMILSDPCMPTDNDVMSCLANYSSETCEAQTSDMLRPIAGIVSEKTRNLLSYDLGLTDEIGEILVEEHSSSSAWRVISQKLVHVFSEICKQKGILKFYCNHVENELSFRKWDTGDADGEVNFTSLAKFCGSPGSLSMPALIQADNDLKILYEVLGKWLDQDRFGLDVEFVQEVLEKLPGVPSLSRYEFLNRRNNWSSLPTVGNGFLVVESRDGLQSEEEAMQGSCRRSKKVKLIEEHVKQKHCPPPGKPLCSRVPFELVGDVFQAWELLGRFHEILGLKEPLSLDELETELINPWFNGTDFPENFVRETEGSQCVCSQGTDSISEPNLSPNSEAEPPVSIRSAHAFIEVETEAMKEATAIKLASSTYTRCCGIALTKAHNSLLEVLIGELQSKVAALVNPNFDLGETRARRGRRKDVDNAVPAKRTKLNMLPINELTWPELARRYILALLSMDGNLDSAEITARESGKVFRCLQGDGGLLCGSLTGVAGMEADALLLAEATKEIFGSLSLDKNVLTLEDEESDEKGICDNAVVNGGNIPEWAQMLEPARKLPTNVGTRIRKCVYDALEKDPPEWARKILEHSISKEVYKGNASGPTKKAVLSVLADVCGDGLQRKPNKGRKTKTIISISDIIMKQCRIVLRRAAAADDEKVFCNLLGTKLINSSDNDDEGLLGSPAMVSRPLDFRTIDLRLAAGAYGGCHEAFHEDVRELWNSVRIAFRDQPDIVELAEELSQNFELLYDEEVVTYVQKFVEYAKLGCLSGEMRKEVDDLLASTTEIPKAPWDEGVCKVCGIDRDDDSVLLCDTCDAEYHTYCLNPPLARIPEGNWYCPSCVRCKNTFQDFSKRTQPKPIGKSQNKRFMGEITSRYLENLTHLSAVMEEKEYWEYSVPERTLLLKVLCDEFLNSPLVRQHLEQCAELSSELHQKLRALSIEWKSLKSKEDLLSTKTTQSGSFLLMAAGEVGLKQGPIKSLSNPGKCLVQPHTTSDVPNNFGVFDDSLSSEDVGKESKRSNSVNKNICTSNSETDGQNINSTDVEGQVKNSCPFVDGSKLPASSLSYADSQCIDKSSNPSHMPQKIDGSDGTFNIQGNWQKHEGRDMSPQIAASESEHRHHELNAVRRDISLLQDSITSVGSQLLKLSVRREFLGIDSIGRLYWASVMPRGCPCIVVDASATEPHAGRMRDSKDSVGKSPVRQNYELSGRDTYQISGLMKSSSPLKSQPSNVLSFTSSWVVYQTDSEIEELLGWLKDNNPKDRALKESLRLWQKSRFQDIVHLQTNGQIDHRGPLSMQRNRKEKVSNSLVMKATSLLEKKYGPLLEWDTTEILKKRGKKSKTSVDEKLYRCECLEAIWPSRKHCMSCHKTFLSDVELEEHNDGKCYAGHRASEGNKDVGGPSKQKDVKSEIRGEKSTGDAETSVRSELRSNLIKFSNKGPSCPYNFEDVCSKFVTKDSNKELVREIGFIDSDGVPSFVPYISPYVSDSTLTLSTLKEGDVASSGSMASESQLFLGKTDGTGTCHDFMSGFSPRRFVVNENIKSGKLNRLVLGYSDQKYGKPSLNNSASEMGVDHCCVVPLSSLRPLVGKVSHILRQLKISLLDMDAALPDAALRPSKAKLERRHAWRAFVKSASSIYEMFQATISFEDMVKSEHLSNDWWYWSSLSAAFKSSTLSSLALRIYSLDSAILYEKMLSNSSLTDSSEQLTASVLEQKPLATLDPEKSKACRKSSRKRKEPDG
ncbi:methyl-CpG-binding domain-containing protein 9 [Senna tora]|uniref:Methyl-CpG-binding domain-containing protein 9 n=1 Tax=Senna tora TaxID=362788 RepID=A0A834TCR4_9FABA|nr:methyl-CpG-binding domain-containing protein 9 [Senna tora]